MIEIFFTYALGVTVAVFLLYFLGVSLAPYLPDKIKNEHFECGLPPSSSNPKKANFSFFIYAIIFIVADMSVLFVSLFVFNSNKYSTIIASIFVLILAFAIFFSIRELELQKKEERC